MSTKPTIAAVFPSNGPGAGGQVVTIAGTGFVGVTAVTFGGVQALSFTPVSPIQIIATVPPHEAGDVAVAVAASGGTAVREGYFRYDAPATNGTDEHEPTPAEAQEILEGLVR